MAASLDDLTAKVEAGERLSDEDMAALGSSRDIIMLGMLASIVRRKLHGTDVTYVRVADLKTGSGGVFVERSRKTPPDSVLARRNPDLRNASHARRRASRSSRRHAIWSA